MPRHTASDHQVYSATHPQLHMHNHTHTHTHTITHTTTHITSHIHPDTHHHPETPRTATHSSQHLNTHPSVYLHDLSAVPPALANPLSSDTQPPHPETHKKPGLPALHTDTLTELWRLAYTHTHTHTHTRTLPGTEKPVPWQPCSPWEQDPWDRAHRAPPCPSQPSPAWPAGGL